MTWLRLENYPFFDYRSELDWIELGLAGNGVCLDVGVGLRFDLGVGLF